MLNESKLGDLFFNYGNDHYWELEFPDVEMDEIKEAVRLDAESFAGLYPEFGKDSQWYYTNFMNRL